VLSVLPKHAHLYLTRSAAVLIEAGAVAFFGDGTNMEVRLTSCMSHARTRKINRLSVWLGGALIEYGMLDEISGKVSRNDIEILVRHQLMEYGVSDSMMIAVGSPNRRRRRLWSAVSASVVDAVKTCIGANNLRLLEVAPILTGLCSNRPPMMKQDGVLVLVDRETSVAMTLAGREVTALSTFKLPSDVSGAHRSLERIAVGLDADAAVHARILATASIANGDLPEHWSRVQRPILKASLSTLEVIT